MDKQKSRLWNTPKSVAVESCGFYAAAPVWRKKGVIYILLKSEQMGYLVAFLPEAYRWYVGGHRGGREVSGYQPHKWLGYSDTPMSEYDAMPIGDSRGDLIVDAGKLLAILRRVESSHVCRVVNGTRIVIALLQAAMGEDVTGRAVAVCPCASCDGSGTLGDYSRGTGKQCGDCEGLGEVRKVPLAAQSEVRP